MALSFAEKRTLQKEIQSCFASLAERPDFKSKRTLQKRLAEAFAKLEGGNGNIKETLLDQLIAGKFISYSAQRFFAILKQVMQEVQNDLEPLKKPIIAFLNAHKNEMQLEGEPANSSGVFESATEIFEKNGLMGCPPAKSTSAAVRATPSGLEYGSPQTITIDIDTDFDSPETFREIIRAIEQARSVDTLILKINSHGGRTDSAQAIYVALLESKAKTIAKVITAYSSGSIVTMACDEIQTTPHCTMMIHNASAASWGKIGEMKAQSSFLENHFKKWFEELYAGFLTTEEIADVFKGQDVWLREDDIKKRLPKWKPIRDRRMSQPQ